MVVRPSLVLRSLALPLTFGWILRHHDTTEYNLLTGSIPSEIGLLTSLQWFHAASMPSISGTIPTEIGLLTSLLGLYLRTCFGVVGSSLVPLSLGLPLTFRWIVRHHDTTVKNQLTGSIPSEFGEMTSLQQLNLCTCFGVSRPFLVPLSLDSPLTFDWIVRYYDSTVDNELDGSIPSEIGLLNNLEVLHLRTYFGVVGSSLVPLLLA